MTAYFRSILCYGIVICLLVLPSVHHSGFAQTFPSQSMLPSSRTGLEGLLGGRSSVGPTGEMFFEGPVNPDDYIVGPGDRLDVVFWQPNFTENPVSVNAEGDVIIPFVGMVSVASVSLREARERIEQAVIRSIRVGKVTVSLIEPRRFRVNVTGLVEMPGTYVVPATARVADAIALAGGLKRSVAFVGSDTSTTVSGSQRRVELRTPDGGDAGHADLLLFRSGGRLKANPRLQDGLTIFVPYAQGIRDQIGIFGAVNNGGLFESADGDDVEDALALAGGLTSQADSSNVVVIEGNGSRTRLDVRGTARSASLAQPLSAGSRVYVSGFADTSRAGSVTLRGEVVHPGGYPIIVGQTTLRDVLDQAGGLLPSAAANSARLMRTPREDPVNSERIRVLEASMMMNPRYGDNDKALAVEFARWSHTGVVLDLSGRDKAGDPAKVQLQDGDVLEVPKNPLGVRVLGAVNRAGEVPWVTGKNLNYYLAQADGVNHVGWKSRAVVVKARNGSQLQYESSLSIDPGDVIFIPNRQQVTTWETFKDVLGVTAQVATVVLIVQNLKK